MSWLANALGVPNWVVWGVLAAAVVLAVAACAIAFLESAALGALWAIYFCFSAALLSLGHHLTNPSGRAGEGA